MRLTRTFKAGTAVAAASAAVLASVSLAFAGSTKASFTLSLAPSTQTVQDGQSVTYTLTLTPQNGFSDTVTPSISGLPSGVSALFSPTQLAKGTTSATLTLSAAANAPAISNDTFTVTGTSPSATGSATASLSVTSSSQRFSVSSTSGQPMLPGGTASYTVTVTRAPSTNDAVTLAVTSGLPTGASATFTPSTVPSSGTTSALQVTTKNNTPSGTYTLNISGTGSGTPTQTATTTASLVISSTGKAFSITAPAVSGVGPGASAPIYLSMSNPNNQALTITNLTVTIQSVTPAAGGSCSVSDFAVTQYTGSYSAMTLAANAQNVPLTIFGTTAQLPKLSFIDDPAHDQSGCKRAGLTLTFSGTGQG